MANAVYDPETEEDKPVQPGSHEDLGMTDEQRKAEVGDLEKNYAASSTDEPGKGKSATAKEIDSEESNDESGKTKESEDKSDQVGKGYNPKDKSKLSSIRGMVFGTKRGRALFGGGIGAVIIGLIVAAFLALLPLKILNIVENLQDQFFSTAENAVQTQSQILLSNYIKKYVIPSLSRCSGSTIDKNCNTIVGSGNNPVQNLYRAWSQAKIENKLADKYKIEIKKEGNRYFIRAPGIPNGQEIPDLDGDGNLFKQTGRNDLLDQIDHAMENETKWKRTMYRFKVGRLLENKYGIKRYVIARKARNNFDDWKDNKRIAAKTILVQRVLEPHAQGLGLVLECVINTNQDCLNIAGGEDGKGKNGERLNKFQRDLQEKFTILAERYGQDAVEKIIADAKILTDKGFTRYAVEKVIGSIITKVAGAEAGEQTAKIAGNAVPVVGAVNTVASVITTLKNVGPTIKYMTYALNSAGMVQMYMTYRTHADEIKSGNVDAELVGSFTSTLSPNQKYDSGSKKFVGAGAEGAPLYPGLINNVPTVNSTAFLTDLFPSASAATGNVGDTTYTCDNGKTPAFGKFVCPEEDLRVGNFVTDISDQFTKAPLNVFVGIADFWNGTAGKVFKFVGDAFGAVFSRVPGVSQIASTAGELVSSALESVTKYLVPSPFSDNMSGGRSFTLMAGGADVAGNEFAHHGIGGRVMSNAEVTTIVNKRKQTAQNHFNKSSLFAKLFDKKSEYSLVTRIAMTLPMNLSSAISSSVQNLLRNPFSSIVNSFGSIFSLGNAGAATPNAPDMCTKGGPFGVTCYGYTDAEIPKDPEAFWNQNCQTSDFSDKWNEAATKNSNAYTHQYENKTTNPCLLIQATVGSAGGYYSDSVLTSDDLDGSATATGATTSTAGAQIVGDIGTNSDSVNCAPNTKDLGVATSRYTSTLKHQAGPLLIRLCQLSSIAGTGQNTTGGSISGGAVVNSRVSGAWQSLGEAARASGVALRASSSFRLADSCGGTGNGSLCAKPGSSPHQLGVAIDFDMPHVPGKSTTSCGPGRTRLPGNAMWDWLYPNAERFGMKQYSYEVWHWDPTNSPSRCGTNQ